MIGITKILNEKLINPEPSVKQENEKSINTQPPVKQNNEKDDSHKIIPLPDFKMPVVLNPLKDPSVEMIYGDSSKADANFPDQADNPRESSNASITPDKKHI